MRAICTVFVASMLLAGTYGLLPGGDVAMAPPCCESCCKKEVKRRTCKGEESKLVRNTRRKDFTAQPVGGSFDTDESGVTSGKENTRRRTRIRKRTPGIDTAMSHAPQIDIGVIDIFENSASGGRGAYVGRATRLDNSNIEIWVIKPSAYFPMQDNFQILRVPNLTYNNQAYAENQLVSHVQGQQIPVPDVYTATVAPSNPTSDVDWGTYLVYTLNQQGAQHLKGELVGAACVRWIDSTQWLETWCLSPGYAFPLKRGYYFEWKTGADDPFDGVDASDLESEMLDWVKTNTQYTVNTVNISL